MLNLIRYGLITINIQLTSNKMNLLNLFFDKTYTPYEVNYLRKPTLKQSVETLFRTDPKFFAPRKIDNRDLCLPCPNQGKDPKCAAHTVAGYAEVINWVNKNYPEKADADEIYRIAKLIDDDSNLGTSLDSASYAAMRMGLVDGELKYISNGDAAIRFAIHTHRVCMAAFMITDEWFQVNKQSGKISNYGDEAIQINPHSVLICGYDTDGIYIRNSWGLDWGLFGFALLEWRQVASQFLYGMIIHH